MQVKDPVCGMSLEADKAHAQEAYQGSNYFFCSDQCHRQFVADPHRYAASAASEKPSGSSPARDR